eukprot:GHVR01148278.1.p1 GENE.GHVR01148278.1~~GHVR01148278.1.p1  ORF type:complete len:278 (+),score=50.51 GHVR01148278.1:36-869(+)
MTGKDYIDKLNEQRGGFIFDNVVRNNMLQQKGYTPQTLKKTGTTICGVMCKDGVVLGADTRATCGPMVSDKCCEKLHYLADNIRCAGAGTAADLEHVTEMMASQLELHRLNTGRQPRVCTFIRMISNTLHRYQGHLSCALVVGGVDINGPSLYMVYPHGSTDMVPFTSMGSGSLCAMSMLETGYRDNMSTDEASKLVASAIKAGILNDLGSGSQVDVTVITKEGVQTTLAYDCPVPITRLPRHVPFKIGTTVVLQEHPITMRNKLQVEDGDVQMRNI